MATQFEIDCASMAGAVYISNRPKINQLPVPEGWAEFKYETQPSGFEAISFRNKSNPNQLFPFYPEAL